MSATSASTRLVRFGVFEFDPATGDLFRNGRRIRLQEQPRQVLSTLVSRPGELITRDDFRAILWQDDTFVDFDTGLNVVVNKVRQALGDSASSPRFIETFPRRGYRFVAPVTVVENGTSPVVEVTPAAEVSGVAGADGAADVLDHAAKTSRSIRWRALVALAATLVLAAGFLMMRRSREQAPAVPGTRIQSLAVLPLENLSADAADDYFAEGMADQLVTDLASISALKVIARQSTRQYKGSTKPVSTIASELGGVDAVIEGSVLRAGNRVRLIVQLIDTRTEQHLLARTYEGDLVDILQLQREAALKIANDVRATLTSDERARLRSARQVNPAAHDAYLRGEYLLEGKASTAANRSQALEAFEQAINIDSTFAPAYVGVAEAQLARGMVLGGEPPLETRPAAFRAVRRALQLDPDLAAAYGTLGRLQSLEFDWPGADESFARMLALAPGSARGLTWYANYVAQQQGRADDALLTMKRAEELDPFDLRVRVAEGFIHSLKRDYARSIEIFEQVLALDPDDFNARSFLVTASAGAGRFKQARAQAAALVERFGRNPVTLSELARAEGWAGNRAAAQRLIEELIERAGREYVSPAHLAFAFAALKDRDRAFDWLERAYEERSNMMMAYPVEPLFAWPDDSRYTDLVARVRQPHTAREGS